MASCTRDYSKWTVGVIKGGAETINERQHIFAPSCCHFRSLKEDHGECSFAVVDRKSAFNPDETNE